VNPIRAIRPTPAELAAAEGRFVLAFCGINRWQ
jgi:hypothetical protein